MGKKKEVYGDNQKRIIRILMKYKRADLQMIFENADFHTKKDLYNSIQSLRKRGIIRRCGERYGNTLYILTIKGEEIDKDSLKIKRF